MTEQATPQPAQNSDPLQINQNGWNTGLTTSVVIILAAIALGFSAKVMVLPVAILLIIAIHVLTGFELKHKPQTSISLLIAIPFALWWRWYPETIGSGYISGNKHQFTALLPVMGFYLLTINFYQLLTHRHGGNLLMALGSSIFAFTLAGAVPSNPVFIPLSLILVPLVFFELRNGLPITRVSGTVKKAFHSAQLWSILSVIVLTVGLQVLLIEKIPEIGQWIVNRISNSASPASYVGFSRQTTLGSMSPQSAGSGDSQVVARVWSKHEPSYLRGVAHARYTKGTWESIPEELEIGYTEQKAGRNLFRLTPYKPQNVLGTVYPESGMAGTIMVPMGTNQIASFNERVWRSSAMTIKPDNLGIKGGYDYYQPDPTLINNAATADIFENVVPVDIQPDIERYAKTILGNTTDPILMINKIESYFQENFTYKIGLQLKDPSKDPIVEFMDDIKAGHCEYFATAAALILRSRGVRARYMTGLSIREKGLGDEYWIARKRDAHAWVEAFIPGKGWMIVEATPSAARPEINEPGLYSRVSDWVSSYFYMFIRYVVFGGINAVMARGWEFLVWILAIVPTWGWAGIVLLGALAFFRKQILLYFRERRENAARYSKRVLSLQARLKSTEKALANKGLQRNPATPIGDFITQVETAPIEEPLKTQAVETLREYQQERFKREPQMVES